MVMHLDFVPVFSWKMKSSTLSQKVSSLKDQMSVLMARIVQLEECDLYMTKIVEVASDQLSCKFVWSPLVLLSIFLCVCFNLVMCRCLLGSCC
jgi:hypothetical protein